MSSLLAQRMVLGTALVGVLSGCGHAKAIDVNGFALNPDPWLEDQEKLTRRATFDLRCTAENLALTVLETGGEGGMYWDDWAVQVGVQGCDARIVYVRTQQGWVANIVSAAEQPRTGHR